MLGKIPESMLPPVFERLAAVTFLTCLAAGCAAVLGFEETTLRGTSEDEAGTTSEGGIDDAAAPRPDGSVSRIAVSPASPVLRRGASTDLTVTIERDGDMTGAITARLSDLPSGVTATAGEIAPSATTATVKLTAAANATLGPKTIKLTAEGTALPAADVPLLVADRAGAPDVTFDTDGSLFDASKGVSATFFAVGVLGDQRIVAAGAGVASPGWMMRRYASDGFPDGAFTTLANASAPANGEARAFAVDGAGNMVFVGSSTKPPAPQQQLTIVKLKPTGALDTTFGGGVILPLIAEAPGGSVALGVAIQPDGAVVVVGSRRDIIGNESGVIARFAPNGTRDATFNAGASVAIAGARFVGVSLEGNDILAAGSSTTGALPSYFLAKRTPAGASDPTFGNGGTASFGNTYRANAFARLADGSFALTGDLQKAATTNQVYTAGVASAKGAALFARGYGTATGAAFFAAAGQADGRVIVAGHTAPNGEARVGRIRLDGDPDPTFGNAGTAILEPAGSAGSDVTLFGAAVQADGRILVAGNRSNRGAIIFRLWH